jgi:adenylosuccinate lyase
MTGSRSGSVFGTRIRTQIQQLRLIGIRIPSGSYNLFCRIKECAYFAPIHEQMEQLMDPATFVGRAPQQVPVVYT